MRPLRSMLIGSLLCLSACATVGNEAIKTATLDDVQGMTKAALITRYGIPQAQSLTVTEGVHRETLSWTYGHGEASPWLWVPIVGLFVAASGEGVTAESHTLTVTFDGQGKAVQMAQSRGTYGSAASK